MGGDANRPEDKFEDESTEQEARDAERWIARIRQALAEKRLGGRKSILPPDPQLTRELRDVCVTIAEAMANNEAAITEALTDPTIRAEMKQFVSGLAIFFLVLTEEEAEQNAETPRKKGEP
jgi:hypothetical protein